MNILAAMYLAIVFCVAPMFAQSAATLERPNKATYHIISQVEAKEMIARYQSINPFKSWAFHAGTLPAPMLQTLLSQPAAASLGYYYALTSEGKPQMIFVARTEEGNDIFSSNGIFTANYNNSPQEVTPENFLTVEQAKQMIKNYQASAAFKILGKRSGGAMFKESVLSLLQQRDVAAARFYFALGADNEPRMVMLGTNSTGTIENSEMLLDRDFCPPFCSGGGSSLQTLDR